VGCAHCVGSKLDMKIGAAAFGGLGFFKLRVSEVHLKNHSWFAGSLSSSTQTAMNDAQTDG
jgi:hypothetical protein